MFSQTVFVSFGIAKVGKKNRTANFSTKNYDIFLYLCQRLLKSNGFRDLKPLIMDIDLLSKMVKELILDNDSVVLPGLGAFVAETVPSTFTDKGFTINPPYRRLYFRSKPDEGFRLAEFYAFSNNVSSEVADRIIRDFVSELKDILLVRKTVIFPGLGRLRATKENAVFFVADENLDIYPEGLGLEPISLKSHQETPEQVKEAVAELKSIVEELPIQNEAQLIETRIPESPVKESVTVSESVLEVPVVEKVVEVVEPEHPVLVADAPKMERNVWKLVVKILLWTILAVIVFLAIFIIISRLNPAFIDRILYTPEELEILNM